jgi:hypothetical protein
MLMTSRIPEPDSEFEEEGIPDPGDTNPEVEATGDPGYGLIAPGDHPLAADDFGTTAAEEAAGETLDTRLAREEPDFLSAEDEHADTVDDDVDTPFHQPGSVGRLVEDDEGIRGDETPEAIAHDTGTDGGGESAEEAAMHVASEEG